MGTNFFVRGHNDGDDPEYHLGKQSAAGLYCWDCGVTLCRGGRGAIHSGDSEWDEACPVCGKTPDPTEGISRGAAARELGFDTSPPRCKNGVASCSSFSWATPHWKEWQRFATDVAVVPALGDQPPPPPVQVIEDEYGRLYTVDEFVAVLSECPVRYTDSVGQRFS
jgi:hypothetical protein